MNYLKKKKFYLSGPIEHSEGIDQRPNIKKELKIRFSLDIFDPHADPKQQWSNQLKIARDKKDFDLMTKIAKDFVRKDLSEVDRTDVLIAYLPYKIPTVGCHHEIINAVNLKKPVLLVSDKNKNLLPLWYYGFIPHQQMFGDWEDLYTYLKEIDDGVHKDNYKWSYIYNLI